jgi:hypothetical protein
MENQKKWTADDIAALLDRNPVAVDRAMITLSAYPNRCSRGDYEKISAFARYVQGLDDKGEKRWAPKSLSDKHAKIFNAQKFIPAHTTAYQMAKEFAMSMLGILTAVANGNAELIDTQLHVATLQRGAYKDTIELIAYRNDSVPENCDGFPFDSKVVGVPTEGDYNRMKTYHSNVTMDLETFVSNYTIVKERSYFLD